jgi:hypothetical protein
VVVIAVLVGAVLVGAVLVAVVVIVIGARRALVTVVAGTPRKHEGNDERGRNEQAKRELHGAPSITARVPQVKHAPPWQIDAPPRARGSTAQHRDQGHASALGSVACGHDGSRCAC